MSHRSVRTSLISKAASSLPLRCRRITETEVTVELSSTGRSTTSNAAAVVVSTTVTTAITIITTVTTAAVTTAGTYLSNPLA